MPPERSSFHLTAPDPEFLDKLTEQDYTAPVPPGTPDRDTGLNPIPGTGPYRIARADATGVRLVRNPFFREWSHAAQPDGNPNVIVWHFFPTQQDAAKTVEQGRADWLDGSVPLREYRQIAIRSPDQLHSHPLFGVEFLPFNTHLAPFNHIAVRKALNYAIDRTLIARMYGGPAFATPTCQPLAPGLPGYRRYCPYTSHPSRNGAYSGPDLTYAKHLVAKSGTRGERVNVWGSADEGYVPPEIPRYVASVLRTLGYRATAQLRPIASITAAMQTRFQVSSNGDWVSDYPDPSSYIPAFFSCGGGNSNGYVCDPALDRQMQRAELSDRASPAAADALWESVDHQLTNQADWLPTVSVREVDFVSKRLGNYEFNPVWGFLVDQSWIQQGGQGDSSRQFAPTHASVNTRSTDRRQPRGRSPVLRHDCARQRMRRRTITCATSESHACKRLAFAFTRNAEALAAGSDGHLTSGSREKQQPTAAAESTVIRPTFYT
jgi:peptide/nickel transport system substrate-binding protein